jgi:hypothetical protein
VTPLEITSAKLSASSSSSIVRSSASVMTRSVRFRPHPHLSAVGATADKPNRGRRSKGESVRPAQSSALLLWRSRGGVELWLSRSLSQAHVSGTVASHQTFSH